MGRGTRQALFPHFGAKCRPRHFAIFSILTPGAGVTPAEEVWNHRGSTLNEVTSPSSPAISPLLTLLLMFSPKIALTIGTGKETATMTIKERIGFVSLTLAAAFVGGAVSGHIFAARTVDAANAPRMITAQKFMLVDRHGKTRGEFNVTGGGVAQIAVFDGTGTLRAGLGVGSDGAPALG